jgi:hypothetical protein
MSILVDNETLDIRAYHCFFIHCAHSFEWRHTWHFKWCHVWLSTDLQTGSEVNVCQMHPTYIHFHMWEN